MNNDVRGLLIQAEQARERGDFKESLELLSSAIVVADTERKYEKLADIAASQALCYRHLFDLTGQTNYLVLAKHAAMASVDISRENKDGTAALSIALYNYGKALESNNEVDEALVNYKEAVLINVDRPAMQAEMKTRVAVLEFKLGDKSAIGRFENALKELIASADRDNYAKAVWTSGAYLHMAEALIRIDKLKAKQMISEAKKIIQSDMRLKIRKQQLEKLEKTVD